MGRFSQFSRNPKVEFISLTDIAKYKSDEPNDVIKNEAGANAFTMSPTKWIKGVNAIGTEALLKVEQKEEP